MRIALIFTFLLTAASSGWTKTARSYYDADVMARVRTKIEAHDWAQAQVDAARQAAEWYLAMGDDELWEFVPPPEQLRAINVNIGHDCPYCGPEITRKAGHYPWILDRDLPFKLKCPVCERIFPENDFEPWNTEGLEGKPESGERIIDRGLGWVGPDGRRYWFVSYYVFWQRWVKDVLGGMETLGRAYLLTGDARYGHACAVMMAKVASEYERLDYATQGYHEGRFGVPGRISDHIWTTGDDIRIALAYDAIYPIFDEDPALLEFLRARGITDPRRTIEQGMLSVMARDVMGGVRAAGNMGMHQRTLCILAIVLDNDEPEQGPTTAEMRTWLMSGPGRVEDLLWNGFWRDGMGAESSPSYSSSWVSNFYQIADLLPRIGVEIWDNPKLRKMADIGIDMAVNGRWGPDIGDCGGPGGGGPIGRWPEVLGSAFTHYGDPRHAQLLAAQNAQARDLFADWFDEAAVTRVVEEHGTEIDYRTRDIGGYGLAILEAGEGENARGLSLYYGSAAGGHGHHDRLNIEMWALGRPLLPEDGYPYPFTRPDFWRWRSTDTHKHYCVVVDETTQRTQYAGQLNALVTTPGLQLVDASAEIAYPDQVSLYRRTAALVDLSPEAGYLLDIFRVRGGIQHDWCFHGPIFFDLALEGGELGPTQEPGTLAGPNVPFGAQPPANVRGGLALNLLAAQPLLTGEDYRARAEQGWALFGLSPLTKLAGAALTCMTVPTPAGRQRVFAHVYDYNAGTNILEVTVAGVTATLTCAPSGAEGWRWVAAEINLPTPATEVTLTARAVGQTYLQIDQLVFVDDPEVAEPRVIGDGTSGYHGLYNVRRMAPTGQWRASWRQADGDQALTMTMPAGIAQEVIVADASPEIRPGNPEVIQYVLGRRMLPDEAIDGGQKLLSTFVATSEPHVGEPVIARVELLDGGDASDTSVGVAVHRAGAVDLVHSAVGREACSWRFGAQTLEVDAEYALVTLDDRGVQRAMLMNGGSLRLGDFVLEGKPALEATVIAVDLATNTITIDAALPDPEELVGRVVLLRNGLHSASYTVTEAEAVEGGVRLGFGAVLCTIGMGVVEATDPDAGTVTADRDLAGYGRIDSGRHAGRWLCTEDRAHAWRIAAADKRLFTLEGAPADLDARFTDVDGDGRRLYWVADVGPGDVLVMPQVTHRQRGE